MESIGTPIDSDPSETQGEHPRPLTINRTCQACRIRKIKCVSSLQQQDPFARKCDRCRKLNLDCVFVPFKKPSRPRRRHNEATIQELERKLEALQESVDSTGKPGQQVSTIPSQQSSLSPNRAFLIPETNGYLDVSHHRPSPYSPLSDAFQVPATERIVSDEIDERLYSDFHNSVAPEYPLVLVPSPENWQVVRKEQPVLFRAVLTAASSGFDPALSENLFKETGKILAEKIVVEGEKSLELVQALLIVAVWHQPPRKYQALRFNQYANMAATMVMDLQGTVVDVCSNSSQPNEDISSLEQTLCWHRSFLACYFLCSSIAVTLRRPNSMPYSRRVEVSLESLDTTSAHLMDRRLAAWTRLQRTAEESLSTVRLDTGSPVDLSDARTRFILKGCVDQVIRWRQSTPEYIMTEPLEIHYQMILINLHEPALYDAHDLHDFKPPFVIRAGPLNKQPFSEAPLEIVNTVTMCISSARRLLLTFLSLPAERLASVPVVTYTRMAYAVIVLVKIYVSIRGSRCYGEAQGHDEEVSPKALIHKVIDKLDAAAGPKRVHVPATFHSVLLRMAGWCSENLQSGVHSDDLIKPLLHLRIEVPENSTQEDSHLLSTHLVGHGPHDTFELNGGAQWSSTPLVWDEFFSNDQWPITSATWNPFGTNEDVPDIEPLW